MKNDVKKYGMAGLDWKQLLKAKEYVDNTLSLKPIARARIYIKPGNDVRKEIDRLRGVRREISVELEKLGLWVWADDQELTQRDAPIVVAMSMIDALISYLETVNENIRGLESQMGIEQVFCSGREVRDCFPPRSNRGVKI